MKQLFENDYMKIGTNNVYECLEIISKKDCDDIKELERHITIINQYVKDTQAKKLILMIDNLDKISKESLLSEKFFPFIGNLGVKNIAVITGEDEKVKTFVQELGSYVSPVKEKYKIITKRFENYQQALQWITQI